MILSRSIAPREGSLPRAERRSGEPIRLLFVSSTFLGFKNDFEQILHYLERDPRFATWAIELVRTPLQRAMSASSLMTRPWDRLETRIMSSWNWRMQRWFRTCLPLSRFDLALAINQTEALAFARQHHLPFAACIDTTLPAKAREFGRYCGRPGKALAYEEEIFRQAKLVVCRNRWSATSVALDHGIEGEKIHVASSSVRLEELGNGSEVIGREKPGLPRLLFVGHAWRRKGGPELLRIHQNRFSDRCELHILSGEGAARKSGRNVFWHGAVSRQEVFAQLRKADLFVLPSRLDMSPWAVLEAAAAGVPVIASRIAAIPEYVHHGRTGFLYPPEDAESLGHAIDRLLDDAPLRKSFSDASRRLVRESYDADQTYPELLDRLASLVS